MYVNIICNGVILQLFLYREKNMLIRFYYVLDHVVVMRKGGYPIAINTDIDTTKISYVEDIQTPIESQM